MALPEERLRSIIESLVLLSAEPVALARIVDVIRQEDPGTDAEAIKVAADALLLRYADPERAVARGFRIEEISGSLQLRTVSENAPYVRLFLAAKPQRLSKQALETLSVIAYRQPATKPEIETIRGVDCGAALKQLLERDLIRIIGKREEIGRPIIYGTTKYFLEFFGVRSLAELPTLREYHELDEEHQRQVDQLGVAPPDQKISELAAAASFLIEVQEDPDLEALDQAVAEVDRVRQAAEIALDPNAAATTNPDAPATDGEAASPESEAAATIDMPAPDHEGAEKSEQN